MNRLLSRAPVIYRIIPRRELSIGSALCWRGGNDKTQYGKPADSWLGLLEKSGRSYESSRSLLQTVHF